MDSKEAKSLAKETLKGNWGKFAGATLLYLLVTVLLGYIPYVGSFIRLILTPVLAFGFTKMFVDFKNGEEVGSFDFFTTGFKFFGKVWGVTFRVFLKKLLPIIFITIGVGILVGSLVLPVVLAYMFPGLEFDNIMDIYDIFNVNWVLVIGGAIAVVIGTIWAMILSYKYMCATFELAFEPEITAKDAVKKSAEVMTCNKLKAFLLDVSFVVLWALTILGLGIPVLWVLPYHLMAKVYLFADISGRLNKPENVEQLEPETPVIEN